MFTVLHDETYAGLNTKIQEKLQLGRYPYGKPFELNSKKCQIMFSDPSPLVQDAVAYVLSDDGEITTLDWKDVSLETVLCLQGLFPV